MIINNRKTLAYQLILIIVLVVSSINLSYSQEPLPARNQISKVFHSKVLNEERQFWIIFRKVMIEEKSCIR